MSVAEIAELHHWPGNPRQGNVALIAESLKVNGQYRPIVVQRSTMRVLAGNHTLLAAKTLGWTTIDTHLVDCDDEQAARIVLVDNRSNDVADYNDLALLALLQDLPDLGGTGYTAADLALLLEQVAGPAEGDTDPDDAPPLPDGPTICQPGDLWQLGPHRLVVGDSCDPQVVKLAMGGDFADLVWTDPPYGVAIVGGNHSLSPEKRLAAGGKTIKNDDFTPEGLELFLREAFGAALAECKPGAAWYVAAPAGPLFNAFGNALLEYGVWRQTINWVKDSLVMGRSDYHYRHEAIFYGWKPGAAHTAPPDRKQDTVWEFPRPKASTEHPTMKPVPLIERAIDNSTAPAGIVLDPFGGSGSTLIACHRTRRLCRTVELDPRYADVICRRYQQHTGTISERAGQSVSFID